MTAMTESLTDLMNVLTIDGQPILGDGEVITVSNPATGDMLGEVPAASIAQTEAAIMAARKAFDDGRWSGLTARERSDAIARLADLMVEHRAELLDVIVAEVGTPITTAGPMQVDQPVAALRFFAEAALEIRSEGLAPAPTLDSISMIDRVPVGVVGAISAYNFPITLAMWKVGAALAAGCTVVLVSSPKTPFATLLLGRLVEKAGIPAGVVNILAGGPEVSSLITTHCLVDKVAFTGSANVGRLVMAQAADTIKGVVLELGGKSPAVILPGTNLSEVVEPLILRLCRNAGQACAAPTRLLVHVDQINEFEALATAVVHNVPIGDPLDPSTVIGPLISEEHRHHVASMVDSAVQSGGRVLAQGKVPDSRGYFYPATLLTDLGQDAPAVREEIFGPVGVVSTYETVDQAVEMANDSDYGLQAFVYGSDTREATSFGRRLRAGTVAINGGGGTARVDGPFGGFKQSGIGRELGTWGVDEYLEVRHMQIATSAPGSTR
ncbi:aldehyde dehydrogenase family protein [Rhodococcus koreensis]|uniref:aldehyde dehydrogenase family protein n=1 Tax=Rhodococcus koreensis TaxID=99653 RepID=UPI00366FE225